MQIKLGTGAKEEVPNCFSWAKKKSAEAVLGGQTAPLAASRVLTTAAKRDKHFGTLEKATDLGGACCLTNGKDTEGTVLHTVNRERITCSHRSW